jgi:hypothetical protein
MAMASTRFYRPDFPGRTGPPIRTSILTDAVWQITAAQVSLMDDDRPFPEPEAGLSQATWPAEGARS